MDWILIGILLFVTVFIGIYFGIVQTTIAMIYGVFHKEDYQKELERTRRGFIYGKNRRQDGIDYGRP